MRGRTIWPVLGLCVLVVAVGAWVLRGDSDVQYRTAAVERGEIEYTISATGTPNAVVTVQVGSQVSGNIMALYADFNSKVTKGQLIARIDPRLSRPKWIRRGPISTPRRQRCSMRRPDRKKKPTWSGGRATLANAKSTVMKAQSAASDAKSKVGRRLALAKEGMLSKEEGETAQATYDQAQPIWNRRRRRRMPRRRT